MAPKDSARWKVWVNDFKDYEEKIAAYEESIVQKEDAIEKLIEKLQQQFSNEGIKLESEQLDTLIYSVTGDDDIEIISVFNNIKVITAKLKELTSASGENIDSAKRYYGMHTLLIKVLLNLQQRYINRVNDHYQPELSAIEKNNRQLMQKTRSLIATSGIDHKKLYAANLDAQQLTEKTVQLYRRYLNKNKDRMVASRKKIYKEYQVAENTYLTVSTAYILVTMMRDAYNLYNSISQLQVPDLLTFDNSAMKVEFKKITGKMGEIKN